MKSRLTVLFLLLAASFFLGEVNADAQVSFSAGIEIRSGADFYDPLTPYGSWVEVGSHGRCWRPTHVETGWRPYSVGHWEWTDAGWYWVSDEPFAWACYHYGGWVFDQSYGWVWVPGTEWAPAWVTWREGGDYIGWAPCGPGGIALAPSLFVFVDLHHFRDHHRPSTLIVNDRTILDRTKRVGDFRRETRNFEGSSRRIVINEGPKVESVQKATGQRFNRLPVTDVIRQTPAPTNFRNGSERGTTERSRGVQQPSGERSGRPDAIAPEPARRPLEPTGRERVSPDTSPRSTPVERERPLPREQTAPERPPAALAPPERPATPTGREGAIERNQPPPRAHEVRPAERPAVRERAPERPAAPQPENRGREREKDNP
jgi:hypothetical protein